jgi:hypothetical protein
VGIAALVGCMVCAVTGVEVSFGDSVGFVTLEHDVRTTNRKKVAATG